MNKVHINAIKRGVELIFKISQEVSIHHLNSCGQDERERHFLQVFADGKNRCKGYKHEDVKKYELQWSNEYLNRFDLGTPYHLLLSNYIDFLKGDISEITDDRIYLYKGGKRQMSAFGFITDIEKARGKKIISDIILPIHNFKMLKAHRLKNVFEAEKAKLIEENKINGIDTDDIDLKLLYIQFLKDELKCADEWAARILKLKAGKLLYQADLIQIEKYKVFVSEEIKKQEVTIKPLPPKKQSISFVWNGNADKELPILHRKLIISEMIDENTALEAFTAIFTGQPIDNIKPIKWIATNKLLAYFLDNFLKSKNWQSIADKGKLFQNKAGKLLTQSDLSSANHRKFGKPKDSEKIDKILSDIKKH